MPEWFEAWLNSLSSGQARELYDYVNGDEAEDVLCDLSDKLLEIADV